MHKELDVYIEGFKRFKENWFKSGRKAREVFKDQSPKVLVIACSDSRVDPALLFDADPGDFFMIRNLSSLVPPYVKDSSFHGISAALEYAVCKVNVSHIIIIGHTHCAGIATLMSDDDSDTEFIAPWLHIAEPALLRVNVMEHVDDEAKHRACEREAILVSLGNLLTFPGIKERVQAGKLSIHGWYFNMTKGTLERWSGKDKAFIPLVS
ncbi:MAG: carbonic anhydrase [Deferribacteraceae bacterium]|jgi:carbonic anhydrase|nr:carbonic anhydrase [Deferribacteraceae bacterium]